MNTINSNRLSGKVAIVTGSSKGRGAEIATQFARDMKYYNTYFDRLLRITIWSLGIFSIELRTVKL